MCQCMIELCGDFGVQSNQIVSCPMYSMVDVWTDRRRKKCGGNFGVKNLVPPHLDFQQKSVLQVI